MLEILSPLEPLILAVHVIICIFLVSVILLQAGKGADMGAAFGGGGSQSIFGARGAATFLQKLTTTAAICFLLTSISLSAIHRNRSVSGGNAKSVVDSHLKDLEPKQEAAPSSENKVDGNPQPAPAEAPAAAPASK